jgi:hypothetical protein
VDLGYKGAGSIENTQLAASRLVLHSTRYAVSAENQRCAIRHLPNVFNKNYAALAKSVHHKAIMYQFVAHIDRRTENCQCSFNNIYRSVDTGTETSGIGKKNLHHGTPTNFGIHIHCGSETRILNSVTEPRLQETAERMNLLGPQSQAWKLITAIRSGSYSLACD